MAWAAAGLLNACSDAGQEPIRDWGELASEGARSPVLQREGDRLRVIYQTEAGWQTRDWTAGEGLGMARPFAVPAGDPRFSGRLRPQSADTRLARASSMPLRNGVLELDNGMLGWSPSVAADAKGELHLAYDRINDGDYDVVYRTPDGREQIVAGSAAFEAHASLAFDSNQRLWLAWDRGRADWGHGEALHQQRELELAVLSEGSWHAAPPWPSSLLATDPQAAKRNGLGPPGSELGPRPAKLAELPRVVADEAGPIWIFYRVMTIWPQSGGRGAARRVAWEIRAISLSDSGWSDPVTLPGSDGPNHDTLVVLPIAGGGVLAAYESDQRIRHFEAVQQWLEPLMTRTAVQVVELHSEGGLPTLGSRRQVGRLAPHSDVVPRDPAPNLGTETYVRMWGDLHRHSDLSRCKMDLDGSTIDQYRYARDVAQLDFLAVTDHYQHLTPGVWAFLRECTDRFQDEGRFLALYGFERTLPGGHRNLLCIDPQLAENAPFESFNQQRSLSGFDPTDWIAIPHQIADRFAILHWKEKRPELEPVVEMFQARRGSYEGKELPRWDFGAHPEAKHAIDYLQEGWRFGFIGSSDHLATSRGFVAAYARDRSRQALFEALKARRCYAATARIALQVRLGEAYMGEEATVDADAPLRIEAEAGGPIARVEVVRGGEIVHSWHGSRGEPGLLTVRLGRRAVETRLQLEGDQLSFGRPSSLLCEDGDDIEVARKDRLVLKTKLDVTDEDGLVVPVTVEPKARLTLRYQDRQLEYSLPTPNRPRFLERTPAGQSARCEVRWDPPALGSTNFDRSWTPGDWQSGDWVYVRVIRTDGEMAWSSPIWIR